MSTGPKWTREEDEKLRALWPNGSQQELEAALPLRSWESCRRRASALGVKRQNVNARRWTEEEHETLQRMRADGARYIDIAKALGLSKEAVVARAWRTAAAQKPADVTPWGRQIDRSRGFPMPMLKL